MDDETKQMFREFIELHREQNELIKEQTELLRGRFSPKLAKLVSYSLTSCLLAFTVVAVVLGAMAYGKLSQAPPRIYAPPPTVPYAAGQSIVPTAPSYAPQPAPPAI